MSDKAIEARLEALRAEREKLTQEEAQLVKEAERIGRTESYAFKDKLLSWIHYVREQDVVVGDYLLGLYSSGRLVLESMHGRDHCVDVRHNYSEGLGVGHSDNLVVLEIGPGYDPCREWIVLKVAEKGTYKFPPDPRSSRKPMAMEAFLCRGYEQRDKSYHPSGNISGTFSERVRIDLKDAPSTVATLRAWNQLLLEWCGRYPESVVPHLGSSTDLLRRLVLLIASGPSLYARTCLSPDLLYGSTVEEFEELSDYVQDNPMVCMKCFESLKREFPGLKQFCMRGLTAAQMLTSQLVFNVCMQLYHPYKEVRKTPREEGPHANHGPLSEPGGLGEFNLKLVGKKDKFVDSANGRLYTAFEKLCEDEAHTIFSSLYGAEWEKLHAERNAPKKRPAPPPKAAPPAKKQKTSE